MYYYVLLTILPINLMPLIHVVKVNDLRSLWVWDKPGDDFLESFWLLWDSEIPAEKCNVTGKVQHLEERNISKPPPLCTADPRPALPGPKLGRKAGTWDWARLEIEPPVTWPNRSEASKPLHVDGQSFFWLGSHRALGSSESLSWILAAHRSCGRAWGFQPVSALKGWWKGDPVNPAKVLDKVCSFKKDIYIYYI